MTLRTGAELVWESLSALGVENVFGVPGTQTVELYEALRRSRLRAVLPTSELAASFMANGYARLGNRVAVLCTIPGPGFTYALTGLAEARLDSAPLIHLTLAPARSPGRRFQLQAIDQVAIARPLVKDVIVIASPGEVAERLTHAVGVAVGGEPGPVLVQLEATALDGSTEARVLEGGPSAPQPTPTERERLAQAGALLGGARRPVLLVGRGASGGGAAALIVQLAERYRLPVIVTPSARGVVPEDHPLVLGFDGHRGDIAALNQSLAESDLILVVGCKLSHSDTNGFGLRLPAEYLIHVDADATIPGSNYPCRLGVCATPDQALSAWLAAVHGPGASQWTDAEIAERRAGIQTWAPLEWPEPVIGDIPGGAARFFSALRRALPRDGVLVTDSGLHQVLARRYFDVWAPGGLIFPTDFQSMGFGLPAALGAKLAQPSRTVVALLGDGGFAMAGFELATAVRERIPVTVIVFNDGQLNLIRLQQLRDYGRAFSVETRAPDLASFAASVGAGYVCLQGEPEAMLRSAFSSDAPTLVEVRVGDSAAVQGMRARSLARSVVRQTVGPRLLSWLKRVLR
jgi:acetolactate synthase I/II/III large subunit